MVSAFHWAGGCEIEEIGVVFMTMSWLMTVQEAGIPGWSRTNGQLDIEFDLRPRRISLDSSIGDDPSPNPNCFGTLRRWPNIVEVRRPDGTRIRVESHVASVHLNFPYSRRLERDDMGRILSPWRQLLVLKGVSVTEVPLGSEVWGEVADEDSQALLEGRG